LNLILPWLVKPTPTILTSLFPISTINKKGVSEEAIKLLQGRLIDAATKKPLRGETLLLLTFGGGREFWNFSK
jgi:hypothetical protein